MQHLFNNQLTAGRSPKGYPIRRVHGKIISR